MSYQTKPYIQGTSSVRNKGIHSITYNMLNLPQAILFNDGHETRYTYAADGRKLRVQYLLNNFAIFVTDESGTPFIIYQR